MKHEPCHRCFNPIQPKVGEIWVKMWGGDEKLAYPESGQWFYGGVFAIETMAKEKTYIF